MGGWWRTGPSSPTPTVTPSTESSVPASSALTPLAEREPATETPVVLSTCRSTQRAQATSGSRSELSPSEPPLAVRSATPPGSPGLNLPGLGLLRDQRSRLLDVFYHLTSLNISVVVRSYLLYFKFGRRKFK